MKGRTIAVFGLVGVVSLGHAQIFREDFETGLGAWGGAQGGPHTGQVIVDPLRPGNHALAFGGVQSGGDLFSVVVPWTVGHAALLRFEYRGTNGHGYFGFSMTDEIGAPVWVAGDEPSNPPAFVHLVNDGLWRTYEVALAVTDGFRLAAEDHGGDPLDAMFDNVEIVGVNESFDAGAAGWRVLEVIDNGTNYRDIFNGPEIPAAVASGGDPGAYLSWTEPDHWGQAFYFDAPASSLGDQAAMYGGVLEWSVRSSHDGNFFLADAVLLSPDRVLVNYDPPQATTTWSVFEVRLLERAGWVNAVEGRPAACGELQEVLANLTGLRIRGEFRAGVETGDLDSVSLLPPTPGACRFDLDADGSVGLGDLTILLSGFGIARGAAICDGDLTEDGQVALDDLSLMLSSFGVFCE